jgi:hypothetical protein
MFYRIDVLSALQGHAYPRSHTMKEEQYSRTKTHDPQAIWEEFLAKQPFAVCCLALIGILKLAKAFGLEDK